MGEFKETIKWILGKRNYPPKSKFKPITWQQIEEKKEKLFGRFLP